MSCGCIYVGDYDGADVYTQKDVIARKAHKCCECKREILPGETYERFSGLWKESERWDSYATCGDCLSIRESFCCDGYVFEQLCEMLWDHISDLQGQIASECILPLTPRAREMVFEMIEEVWAELEADEEE